jgi:predicted transcriptional regulator
MLASQNGKSLNLVKTLADDNSRKILLSIISKPLSIEEISLASNVSIKTCRKRARMLETSGMIARDNTNSTDQGETSIRYRSTFKNATIDLDSGKLTVNVRTPQEMHSIWSALRSTMI